MSQWVESDEEMIYRICSTFLKEGDLPDEQLRLLGRAFRYTDKSSLVSSKLIHLLDSIDESSNELKSNELWLKAMQWKKAIGVVEDLQRARHLFERGAAMDCAKCQCSLGYMLRKGEGCPEADAQEAIRWYRAAADQHYIRAVCNLAYLTKHGIGTTRNLAEAARLYQIAVDAGDPTGMLNLGIMYRQGQGVTRDYTKAVQLYERASTYRGVPRASYNLALLYIRGAGVSSSTKKAAMLLRRSQEQESRDAVKPLQKLYDVIQNSEFADEAIPYGLWKPTWLTHSFFPTDIKQEIIYILMSQRRRDGNHLSRVPLGVALLICSFVASKPRLLSATQVELFALMKQEWPDFPSHCFPTEASIWNQRKQGRMVLLYHQGHVVGHASVFVCQEEKQEEEEEEGHARPGRRTFRIPRFCAEITFVVVDEKLRGQGFGRKLIDRVKNRARHSASTMVLQCREPLVGFYLKCGFVKGAYNEATETYNMTQTL